MRRSEREETREYHFSFGDCCIAVTERKALDSTYPILFFLHGRFGHAGIWSPILNRLFPRFRCLSVDLPGFGGSFSARERGVSLLENARLVHLLVEEFLKSNERAILVGHDVGGAIAQICATEGCSKLAGIALINCSGLSVPLYGIRTGWLGWASYLRLRRLLKRSRRSFEKNSNVERLLMDPWRRASSRSALVRAHRAWEVSWPGPFERQFWRREVKKLSIPVLLLWGMQDPINLSEDGLQLIRDVPEAYYFESEESGHWPYLDSPDWVSEKIQEFAFRLAVPRQRSLLQDRSA